jgi:hypothetical protein
MFSGKARTKIMTRGYLAARGGNLENGIINVIDRVNRNRKEWLRKTFGGPEAGYYDGIYVATHKR